MTRALWLPAKLRDRGVYVIEHSGWQTRGSDTFTPRGIVCHHTASSATAGDSPALTTCINGRIDLPGPLAHIVLSRSGVVHVIASGRANHAGVGGWNGLSGNSSVFGIEAENNGIGEPWPDVQIDAYIKVVAAICDGGNINVDMVCGHKEWAPTRKIDPKNIDMNWFRDEVRKALGAPLHTGGPINPTPTPAPSNLIKLGSTGAKVVEIQNICNFWGWNAGAVDGVFGPGTEAAVKRAQSALKITADGIWGPGTQKAYDNFVAAMQAVAAKPPTLRKGDKGEWVKKAQRGLGYLTVDGDFGERTYLRVLKVQRLHGLKQDGIIGPQTWNIIL